MMKKTINFWILLLVSIAISAMLIGVFVKALKFILMMILILALTPIIYIVLRLIFPTNKSEDGR
ncbi:hypothetical protein [Pontibacter oryzae]|uniref:Uncharacterized protein n=1 Tax=Pontibacter oryzae TaxID=2304593 RepID=A0A399S5Q5_9BACT|nr:hypothetical protein [Pontibacter oryzae]RIJ37392.1 hypothetical protein D1627_09685 [Pontibacter oryzae]